MTTKHKLTLLEFLEQPYVNSDGNVPLRDFLTSPESEWPPLQNIPEQYELYGECIRLEKRLQQIKLHLLPF